MKRRNVIGTVFLVALLVSGLALPAGAHDDAAGEEVAEEDQRHDEALGTEADEPAEQADDDKARQKDGAEKESVEKDGAEEVRTAGQDEQHEADAGHEAHRERDRKGRDGKHRHAKEKVTFVKKWRGHLGKHPDGVEAEFKYRIDGDKPRWIAAGDSVRVPAGKKIRLLDERTRGLPDHCTFEAELPDELVHRARKHGDGHTFVVTNVVKCARVAVTIDKKWVGDLADFTADDFAVTFTSSHDGHETHYEVGDTITLVPGGSFTLTEHVEVPEDCEVVASHRLAYEAPPLAKWFDHFHRLKAKDTLRVVNKVVCEVPRPEVEPVAIRLVKLWFDTDGQRVGAPEGDWSVSLDSAVIDAEQPQAAWASVSGSSYTVTESSLPAGWEEVSCFGAGLDLPDLDPGYLEASGTGTHDVTGKGTHAVCNRAVVEVAPVVIEEVVEVEVVEVREVAAVEVREVAAVEVLPVTGGSLLALVLSGLGTLLLGTGIVGRFGRRR